jgi:hypothetical protein
MQALVERWDVPTATSSKEPLKELAFGQMLVMLSLVLTLDEK